MDLSGIKEDFRKEIVRGGEVYLDGQVKIATAADSRASGLAGMFIAAATALTAGVLIALYNPSGVLPDRIPLMFGGAAAAMCFLAGAFLCVRAIQPVPFYLPGCRPESWSDDISAKRDLIDCLGERAKHIQEQILDNAKVIEKNAALFKWGGRLGIAAPFLGVAVWLLVSICHWIR